MNNIPCKTCKNKCFRCFLQCEAYKTWRANRDDMLMQKWQYKVISAPIKRKWGTRQIWSYMGMQ